MKQLISHIPYRKIGRDGKPMHGDSNLVYADHVATQGYQLVAAEEAAHLHAGDEIPVGTGYTIVAATDPTPGRQYPGARKVIPTAWRRIERIGKPYDMILDSVVTEDRSMSGERIVDQNKVAVRRLYFESHEG